MRVKELVKFITARESVRVNKANGKPRPWTKDPILDKYRFCNVHREDDYVTQWLRANWYLHLKDDPDVWFAAVVARLFNLPASLYEIMPFVLPWKPEQVRKILHKRKAAGLKNFNAAYIVSTNGIAMDKIDYIVTRVLGPLWAARKKLRPFPGRSLAEQQVLLTQFDGLGSFIAAQVIADLKYIAPLDKAKDWHTFASSGPGSRRGLNRVCGRSVDAPWNEQQWRAVLGELQERIKPLELHAQDLQNCLCEFDKYERTRLGEGTPKQIYMPNKHDPMPF
jgi:hypothetical protein